LIESGLCEATHYGAVWIDNRHGGDQSFEPLLSVRSFGLKWKIKSIEHRWIDVSDDICRCENEAGWRLSVDLLKDAIDGRTSVDAPCSKLFAARSLDGAARGFNSRRLSSVSPDNPRGILNS
jgi:hypothetical protein